VRVWARGGTALLVATVAGVLAWSLLGVVLPAPETTPRDGPVLETVTPAQLAAMGVRLEPSLQPAELPDWLATLGVRLPGTVLLAGDAEGAVRRGSGGVKAVTERAMAYATLTGRGVRVRGPTIAHRLVWAVVGTRSSPGSVGGLMQVLWLVDARNGRQLAELTVLAPARPGGGPALPPAVGQGV